LISGCIS